MSTWNQRTRRVRSNIACADDSTRSSSQPVSRGVSAGDPKRLASFFQVQAVCAVSWNPALPPTSPCTILHNQYRFTRCRSDGAHGASQITATRYPNSGLFRSPQAHSKPCTTLHKRSTLTRDPAEVKQPQSVIPNWVCFAGPTSHPETRQPCTILHNQHHSPRSSDRLGRNLSN
jgi:hypothetical protein